MENAKEPENIAVETIQSETDRKTNTEKKMNKASMTCGTMSSSMEYVQLKTQRRRKAETGHTKYTYLKKRGKGKKEIQISHNYKTINQESSMSLKSRSHEENKIKTQHYQIAEIQ